MPIQPSISPLVNNNYANWAYQMRALLEWKGLWDIIDCSTTHLLGSANSKAVKDYVHHCHLAKGEIISCIDSLQLLHTLFNDPADLWDNLAQIHHQTGFGSIV